MTMTRTCPACGAGNPVSSEWCSQCFVPLSGAEQASPGIGAAPPVKLGGSSPTPAPGPPAPGQPSSPPPPPAPGTGPPVVLPTSPGGDVPAVAGPSWTCSTCGRKNPLTEETCAVCQTSIYESFGAGAEHRSVLPPARAVLWSILPGAGHIKQGLTVLGVSIAGLVLSAAGFGIALAVAGNAGFGFTLIAVAVAVWAVSISDARRIARGDADSVLLSPRLVTLTMGLVVLLLVFAAFAAAGKAPE